MAAEKQQEKPSKKKRVVFKKTQDVEFPPANVVGRLPEKEEKPKAPQRRPQPDGLFRRLPAAVPPEEDVDQGIIGDLEEDDKDLLIKAILGIAPALIGGAFGGTEGAAVGSGVGTKTLQDITKTEREDKLLKEKAEERKFQRGLGERKFEQAERLGSERIAASKEGSQSRLALAESRAAQTKQEKSQAFQAAQAQRQRQIRPFVNKDIENLRGLNKRAATMNELEKTISELRQRKFPFGASQGISDTALAPIGLNRKGFLKLRSKLRKNVLAVVRDFSGAQVTDRERSFIATTEPRIGMTLAQLQEVIEGSREIQAAERENKANEFRSIEKALTSGEREILRGLLDTNLSAPTRPSLSPEEEAKIPGFAAENGISEDEARKIILNRKQGR